MLGIAKHSKIITTLIVAMFIVGGSGVAFVLQTCSMPRQMACCQMMDDGATSDCAIQTPLSNTVSLRSDMSCNTTTLVGGYTTNPGVVENYQQVHAVPVSVVLVDFAVVNPRAFETEFTSSRFAENASPPSVDKHILNATLLI